MTRALFICIMLLLTTGNSSYAQGHAGILLRGDTIKYNDKPIWLLKNDSRYLKANEYYLTTLDATPLAKIYTDRITDARIADNQYLAVQLDEPKITMYRLYNNKQDYYQLLADMAKAYRFDEDKFDTAAIKLLATDRGYVTAHQFEAIRWLRIDSVQYHYVADTLLEISIYNKKIAEYKLDKYGVYNFKRGPKFWKDYFYVYDLHNEQAGEVALKADRSDYYILSSTGILWTSRKNGLTDKQLLSTTVKLLLLNLLLKYPDEG